MDISNIFSTPEKVTYSELREALKYYGYTEINISDQWFIFYSQEKKRFFTLHNPDLRIELYSYQIEQAIEEFKEAGIIQ